MTRARLPRSAPPLRWRACAVLLVLVACALRSAHVVSPERPSASGSDPAAERARGTEIGGWVNYWDFAAGMQDVRSVGGRLSDVFLFGANLDASGAPVAARADLDLAAAVRLVRASGARAWLTIVNDVVDGAGRVQLKDAQVVHAILSDPGRRAAHRAAIVALARRHGVSGVDLDYERLLAGDRASFTVFAGELRGDLAQAGMALSVTVQPKTAESRADGPGSMDWAALCRSVDRLQVMLYNEHSAKTGPGPVASVAWIDRVLRFGLTQCPAAKLVAAIKTVGIEWSGDQVRDVPFSEAFLAAGVAVEAGRDDGVPWLSLGAERTRTVYFEDARSLAAKLAAVEQLGITRVVLWTLGSEDPRFWDVATGLIRARAVPGPVSARPRASVRGASRS